MSVASTNVLALIPLERPWLRSTKTNRTNNKNPIKIKTRKTKTAANSNRKSDDKKVNKIKGPLVANNGQGLRS